MLKISGVVKILGVTLLLGISAAGISAQTLKIEEAIKAASNEIVSRVPEGSRIAVVNFNASTTAMSDYVINELIYELVNAYKFQVIPRNEVELEITRNELAYQMSGEVDDESQKSLGRFLGADSIISGTFVREDNSTYRFRINVLDTEKAIYQVSFSRSVTNDSRVKSLLTGSPRSNNMESNIDEKIGYGALNMVFGLGAYMQGDMRSGIIMSVAEGLGLLLIIWEIAGFEYYDEGAGVPGFFGLLSIGGSVVYGFVQPFIYRNNPSLANITDKIHIGFAPDNRGDLTVSLSYRLQF